MQTKEIGEWVQFFPHADISGRPAPGLVVNRTPAGVLTLLCWSTSGGDPILRKSVRHHEDLQLKANPDMSRRDGGWGHIPSSGDGEDGVSVDEVLKMHRNGICAVDIAEELGTTHQKVNGIIRKASPIAV